MIDTGASRRSTAGYSQYVAYQKAYSPRYTLDTTNTGGADVQFGLGVTTLVGSVLVDILVGQVRFYVVYADTPFLLCLANMDALQVYYNNIKNVLITPSRTVPIARRFGHPFMLWNQVLSAYITDSIYSTSCYLTETELRRLYRRFGHPMADRLSRVLERAGYDDVDRGMLCQITKLCTHCQRFGKSLGRFKFTLRDDTIDFNHTIFVDVMYIEKKPILHIIDEATRY